MTQPFSNRLRNLREGMCTVGADTLVFSSDAALRYLTGLSFPAGEQLTALIVSHDAAVMVLPATEQDRLSDSSLTSVPYTSEAELLRLLPLFLHRRVAVEKSHLTLRHAERIARCAGADTLADAEPLLSRLRMYKDDFERASLLEACRRTDRILARWQNCLLPGTTEQALRGQLFTISCEEGVTESCPGILIASGVNSSVAHGLSRPRTLQRGDTVFIDCGARWAGYYCDITRTFFLGEPGPEVRNVYRIVQEAQAAAIDAVQLGRPLREIDLSARSVIETAGYGSCFTHRTGHGLGLAVHEAPSVGPDSTQVVESGMVITVEPGIYLKGRWGIRIEDDVAITAEGIQVLNTFSKDIDAMILPR